LKRLSQTDEYTQYNDIWGFVGKDGLEYAILGTTTGTAIYSLKDPKNPKRDTFIPGNTSIWRDMKSFKNHVYVTADQGNQGVLIINIAVYQLQLLLILEMWGIVIIYGLMKKDSCIYQDVLRNLVAF
jgi:hypothetical protein